MLREAARKGNVETMEAELDAVFPHFTSLVELRVLHGPPANPAPPYDAAEVSAKTMAHRDRGRPVDAAAFVRGLQTLPERLP